MSHRKNCHGNAADRQRFRGNDALPHGAGQYVSTQADETREDGPGNWPAKCRKVCSRPRRIGKEAVYQPIEMGLAQAYVVPSLCDGREHDGSVKRRKYIVGSYRQRPRTTWQGF